MNRSNEIEQLEIIARQLEPGTGERQDMFRKCEKYIRDFLENLSEMPAYQEGSMNKLKESSMEPEGKALDDLLEILRTEVDATGINPASGKHLGYIPGGGVWTSALADLLAATTNRYAGVAYASPAAVAMENKLIQWLCSIIGYPETAHGNLSSGGSVSNLIAIQAARDFHGINSENVKKACVYFTDQVHHCVHKAFHTTGLYEAIHRPIPMNENYQMDASALEHQIKKDTQLGLNPVLIIATAGTTDTGAIDPLDEIAEISTRYGTWFHVDAAYGGFFVLVDELKHRFSGISKADSVVMDPHKTLFLPYGSGVVLVKDRDALLKSNSRTAAYMKDTYGQEEISPADAGPELSKHFRGLRMWLPLQLHGLRPFQANLKEKWLLSLYFREEIINLGLRAGPVPELSVTIFRCDESGNTATKQLLQNLHDRGTFFFSSTEINGRLWIRCAIASFRTHYAEVRQALDMIREATLQVQER